MRKDKIEMIFFDMGGTLDLYPRSEAAVIAACAKMQDVLVEAGAGDIRFMQPEAFRDIVVGGMSSYKKWRKIDDIELSPEELWTKFMLQDLGIDKEVLQKVAEDLTFLADTGFVKRTARPELPDVLELLSEKDIRMGIISNVQSITQVPYSMAEYGITDYFDTVVLSAVLGKRKPHPDIFHDACMKAGVKPENILYIGNSPSKDIDGAKGAGYGWTVLIDYEFNEPDDTGSEPDYHISSLNELPPIIDQLISEYSYE